MAKTGPPPQPTALRKLRGNPSKRPLPKNEAQPRPGIPSCPRHIQGEARKEWRRISRELAACGLLTRVDRAALAAYCQTWERWLQAEDAIRVGGILIRSKFSITQNPAVIIARDAMDQMRRFLVEFGMTPASRTRVQAQANEGDQDPLDKFREFGVAMRRN